jgi:uroporphyrinogen III methyltransferase/synthase
VSGRVYLVGAGPWDPGLITIRGQMLLRRADTIVYDYLVNPEILQFAGPQARLIPTGPAKKRRSQNEISQLLIHHARAGDEVVRLKGGDPFVFGRGGEEAEALVTAGIAFEVVPGVTAAIASCAYAGIPVTHRDFGSTLGFCTGHMRDDSDDNAIDWHALSGLSSVVFYMSARRLNRIRDGMIGAGRLATTPVALIRWATRPDQTTVETDLARMVDDAERYKMDAPLTVIVGDVVGLRTSIEWYEKRPLHGQRIVVTRSRFQQCEFSIGLRELGASVLAYPTIKFEAVHRDFEPMLARFQDYHWIVFTSANGVHFFMEHLARLDLDSRFFGQAKIACVGPVTARSLKEYGLKADLVPTRFVAEGLADALMDVGVQGKSILIPRAQVARDILPDSLRRVARVEVLPVYRTGPADIDQAVRAQIVSTAFDIVTFTASSTVHHFVSGFSSEELANIQQNTVAACIGPITAETARKAGFRVNVVAKDYTIQGFCKALADGSTTDVDKTPVQGH